MLRRLMVVIAGLTILATGIVACANVSPTLDANGNPAPRAAASWPDNLNRDPAGEWSAFFDIYKADSAEGEAIVRFRWPIRAFPTYGDCIRTISTDAGFTVDFRAVMGIARESFGDGTAIGLRCAPYKD